VARRRIETQLCQRARAAVRRTVARHRLQGALWGARLPPVLQLQGPEAAHVPHAGRGAHAERVDQLAPLHKALRKDRQAGEQRCVAPGAPMPTKPCCHLCQDAPQTCAQMLSRAVRACHVLHRQCQSF
jgi:hypothetical protein